MSDARARPEAPAASGEIGPLRLGPLEVRPPVVLAPMAGITNPPFRALCREYGAGLCISEMITARGWLHGNRMTRLLAAPGQGERPRSVQVYGTDPADVGEMVRQLVDEGVDHVDLNLGCPVPKVTSKGENVPNYENAEYDRLFERMENMENGPERLAIIRKMLHIIRRDAPWVFDRHDLDYEMYHSWCENAFPHALAYNQEKYRRIDVAARREYRRKYNTPIWWPIVALGLLVTAAAVPAGRAAARHFREI